MQLSSILSRFAEPETLKMAKLGRELRAKGIDVIDLSLGEPDFDTPTHIKDAAKKAIDDNWSHYTPVSGYLDLREAVCTKFKRDNNLEYKPENIVVSTGAKQILHRLSELDWSSLSRLKLSIAQVAEIDRFLNSFLIYHLGKVPNGRSSALAGE